MPHNASQTFTPTREAGLARLAAFLPRAGSAYARDRNDDRGPHDRDNVSMLSPYLRHRLLTEHEVVAAAIAMHGARGAQKFVQEVLWRTYWKGWLQMRPSVWTDFVAERDVQRATADADPALAARLARAEAGATGIDGFDHWARELVDTGYLHNHARMWFASIWIFTLRLPWALGADVFLRHLLDADPASNTLSWRWVAGLQTVGKPYVATADNIARCTAGRFRPTGLATDPVAIAAPAVPAALPLAPADALPAGDRALLLVTPEDLHPDSLPLGGIGIAGTLCVRGVGAPQPWPWGAHARDFVDGAVDDVVARLRDTPSHGAVEVADAATHAAVADRARAAGVTTVITADAAVGPIAAALDDLRAALAADGIALLRVRRDWDARFWPHATRGFFPFRERIDSLLRELGLPV